MKMFKKIAATVMAAAMSLAMLTACGGGGGGSTTQYKMAKVLAESQKTGKVYSDITTTIDGGMIASNMEGRKITINVKSAVNATTGKSCVGIDDQIFFMTTKDGSMYEIWDDNDEGEEDINKLYWVKIGQNSALAVASSAIPSTSDLSKLQIRPNYKYGDEEYYAEVITSGSTEVAYCFSGDTLKYIIISANGQEIVETVNKISGNFPAKIADDSSLSYDDLMNLPTRG